MHNFTELEKKKENECWFVGTKPNPQMTNTDTKG